MNIGTAALKTAQAIYAENKPFFNPCPSQKIRVLEDKDKIIVFVSARRAEKYS